MTEKMKMLLGVVTAIVMIAAFANGMHDWGKWVDKSDRAAFVDYSAMQMKAATAACGRRGEPVKTQYGWLCLYVNSNGETVTRPVLDNPIGAM